MTFGDIFVRRSPSRNSVRPLCVAEAERGRSVFAVSLFVVVLTLKRIRLLKMYVRVCIEVEINSRKQNQEMVV